MADDNEEEDDDDDDDDDDDGEGEDDEEEDEDADATATAGTTAAGEEEEEAVAEEEEAPAAKKKATGAQGSMLAFMTKHAAPKAAIATPRKQAVITPPAPKKLPNRNVKGRGPSKKKQGSRANDGKNPKTLDKRIEEHPGHLLRKTAGQLFCGVCQINIGSSKQVVDKHCTEVKRHQDGLATLAACDKNKAEIQKALHDYADEVVEQHGEGSAVRGMDRVPHETQAARAECLEEWLKAGIEVAKMDKLRAYMERRLGISLTQRNHMVTQYLPPLKLKELKTLMSEFKGEMIGVYHDGTTCNGEAFCIVWRAVLPGFIFRICCVKVAFLRGSMTADQISAELIKCIASDMRHPVADVLAWQSDCVAANLASYRDSLKGPFPYSDHNGCIPHTGNHVGDNMDTPHVDEYMAMYNACVSTSNYAVVLFKEITGKTSQKRSATRWFSTNDVQELSLLPNAANGNLLKWADQMIEQGICEKTAPKMRAFLLNPAKLKLFLLELTTVVYTGKALKARNTAMEGDTFEFITGYDTIMNMGAAIKQPITPELRTAIEKLAVANGAQQSSLFGSAAATPAAPAGSVVDILKSLSPAVLKTVNMSINAEYWDWHAETPPQPRYTGKATSWVSQETGKEELRIKWEMGRDDHGQPQVDGAGNPKYEPTAAAKLSELMLHGLRLDAFDDGAAAPTLSSVAPSDTHLLSSTDLSDVNVLLARAKAVVSPAAKYFETSMEGKRGGQLARMKAVRFFNPLHVQTSSNVTEADINGLEAFRFSKHPKIAPKIEAMKSELVAYNTLIKESVKPLPQRVDAEGNDTFSLLSFWRASEDKLPAFAYVLRAILANSPNSVPPERVFSILNNTFDDDQGNALADYMELSLQLQFNARSRAQH